MILLGNIKGAPTGSAPSSDAGQSTQPTIGLQSIVIRSTDHYQAVQDAEVRLTLVNNSRDEDVLTEVSSPQARFAVIRWDRG